MSEGDIIATFFKLADGNRSISTTHFGLFMALLQCYHEQGGKNPFHVSRSKLMKLARIKSTSTYQTCINDLKGCGIMRYTPSYHPTIATEVVFLDSVDIFTLTEFKS